MRYNTASDVKADLTLRGGIGRPVFVVKVTPGGSADRAGVLAGYRIAAVNDSPDFENAPVAMLFKDQRRNLSLDFGDPKTSYIHFFSLMERNRAMLPRAANTPRTARIRLASRAAATPRKAPMSERTHSGSYGQAKSPPRIARHDLYRFGTIR